MAQMTLLDREIGPEHPVYIIAEMSGNHNQDYDRAVAILEAAHAAGADAVKLQTYTADTMTIDCDAEPFVLPDSTIWSGRNLHDLYGEANTPWEWHPELKARADELGLHLFSSPFDSTAVDFLEQLGVPAYKVASFELNDLPLLRRIAATGKPVIASTGMATLGEIDEAVRTLRENGCRELALLKCCSSYPADPAAMNLSTIPHLGAAFDVVAGLSDHTMDVAVPVAAVTMGARIIEKHLTLDRAAGGPDSAFSLEPHEFRVMVDAVRVAEQAVGKVSYKLTESEQVSRAYRRSIFVVQDIHPGGLLTPQNIRVIRPGNGLEPKYLDIVLGRRAARELKRGTPLGWEMLQS